MKFENKQTNSGGESYERPKPGKYLGVLVGFAYIGTQPSGQYEPRPRVLLRWELHKRKGPSVDSKGFIHTVTATYGATVTGKNSNLRKVMEAHHGIGTIEPGQKTDTKDWLGRVAWLDLKGSEDVDEKGEPKYINVVGVSPLDSEEDEVPHSLLETEHWDDEDAQAGFSPPAWASFWVGRSLDLKDLVRNSSAPKSPSPVRPSSTEDEDDIPF